jgi:hypothetical protein
MAIHVVDGDRQLIQANLGDDPAISSGIIALGVFGFGPLVGKPRIRRPKFGDDPAISSGVNYWYSTLCVFSFGTLVAKPRI